MAKGIGFLSGLLQGIAPPVQKAIETRVKEKQDEDKRQKAFSDQVNLLFMRGQQAIELDKIKSQPTALETKEKEATIEQKAASAAKARKETEQVGKVKSADVTASQKAVTAVTEQAKAGQSWWERAFGWVPGIDTPAEKKIGEAKEGASSIAGKYLEQFVTNKKKNNVEIRTDKNGNRAEVEVDSSGNAIRVIREL